MHLKPLTAQEEDLYRTGLDSAPALDGSQQSLLEYTTAEWADRCRRIFATLDRERRGRLTVPDISDMSIPDDELAMTYD